MPRITFKFYGENVYFGRCLSPGIYISEVDRSLYVSDHDDGEFIIVPMYENKI